MRALILWLAGLSVALPAAAQQAPTLQWQRRIGQIDGSGREYASGLARSNSGRIVALGSRLYIPKLWFFTATGDSLTTVTFQQLPNDGENFSTASTYSNGDFLLVGGGSNYNAPNEAWHTVTRTDSMGNVRWQQKYNRSVTFGNSPYPGSLSQLYPPLLLPDGGALIPLSFRYGGTSAFNPGAERSGVLRIDSAGNVLWQRMYGQNYSALFNITACPDGSYALAGYQKRVPPGQQRLFTDAWVLRINLDGDTLRSRTFGVPADGEVFYDVKATPGSGLLLVGSRYPALYSGQPPRGWLVRLDSTDRVRWQHEVAATQPAVNGAELYRLEMLQGGDFLVQGWRANTGPNNNRGYLARYHPPTAPATAPTPAWEVYVADVETSRSSQVLAPDGQLSIGTYAPVPNTQPTSYYSRLNHYSSVGQPLGPGALCATPPQANAAFVRNAAGDTLRLFEVSGAGPRYAQNVAWRWTLPGGVVLTQAQPPAQRVLPVPPAGTPVVFTVTNNLGCTSTQTLYPWGPLSVTQAARQLAARASVYPNPATAGGGATLALAGLPGGSAATVQVRDALGRAVGPPLPVRAGADGTAALRLPLAGQPAGVYAVLVRTPLGQFAKRLVLE